MKQLIGATACWLACATVLPAAQAQERIYRCGNEYTNSAAIAKQRNCQVVEGGHVTVVHTRPASAIPAGTGEGKASTPAPAGARAVQVDPSQQKARDSDARAILQAELVKAQEKLKALKAEYNDGYPTKSALELRNAQVYNERLESLKASIARQESDIAGIQRELARHSGG